MSSSAADMFAQSLVDMVREDRLLRETEESARAVEEGIRRWEARLKEIEEANAANLAEKYALRQQLERYAPDHPLLKNKQLVEKIQGLGVHAFATNRNFDDARRVGETYFPPDTPPIRK